MKVTVLNKKVLAVIALAVLLVIAGFINYKLAGDKNTDVDNVEVSGESTDSDGEDTVTVSTQYTTSQRLLQYEAQRKIERQKELLYLEEIIDDENSDEASLQAAIEEKLRIIESMEYEQVITELLIAKGFSDALVVCGESSVNVIVGQENISNEHVAQILSVVIEETGKSAEEVKIIPIE